MERERKEKERLKLEEKRKKDEIEKQKNRELIKSKSEIRYKTQKEKNKTYINKKIYENLPIVKEQNEEKYFERKRYLSKENTEKGKRTIESKDKEKGESNRYFKKLIEIKPIQELSEKKSVKYNKPEVENAKYFTNKTIY